MFCRTFCLLGLLCLAWCSPAAAQLDNYNPYAQSEEVPAVSEDGTINWPPFFKSAKMEARFQAYFLNGSCKGTKMAINNKLNANKVDVNHLPKISIQGKAVKLLPGIVGVIEASGKTALVVTHPLGVSHVSVSGSISPEVIRPGLALRFIGKVDETGRGVDVIDSLEIVTLSEQIQPLAVTPDRVQTIVGKVTKRHGNLLRLVVDAGELKSLSILISPDAKAVVNGSSLDLLSLGDEVAVEGHVYSGQGSAADRTIFADDLAATKPTLSATP